MLSKRQVKYSVGIVGASLVLMMLGSFVLAAKKLTPDEWSRLTAKKRVEYKTIELRDPRSDFVPIELGEEVFPIKGSELNFRETIDSGETWVPIRWYSKALFETLHPKVKIKYIEGGIWGGAREVVLTGLAGGTAPFIYTSSAVVAKAGLGWKAKTAMGINKEMFADITDLVKDWDQAPLIKQANPGLWTVGSLNGRHYGVPRADSGLGQAEAMEFNRDWFKEAGIFNKEGEPGPPWNWTLEDFRKFARKLTDPKKKHWGIAFTYAAGPLCRGNYLTFGNLSEELACRVPDKGGKNTWKFALTEPALKYFKFLQDMRWKDKSILAGAKYTGWWDAAAELRAGRTGMTYSNLTGLIGKNVGVYDFAPDKPNTEFIGAICNPRGEYGLRQDALVPEVCGFDPTLSKEELKAAFDWYDWTLAGRGAQLYIMEMVDRYRVTGKMPVGLAEVLLLSYFDPWLGEERPKTIPKVSEFLPKDYLEMYEYSMESPPRSNDVVSLVDYGLIDLDKDTFLTGVKEALYDTIMSKPDVDIQAEAEKLAKIAATELSYKIKGDKEKLKNYFDALGEFYKKWYPEFYEKEYKLLVEKYYKVW